MAKEKSKKENNKGIDFFVVTEDILKKMWEGASKETELLNGLCKKSTQAGKPMFGTEIKPFLKSMKDAYRINGEAIQTFLRFGRIDFMENSGNKVVRLNN